MKIVPAIHPVLFRFGVFFFILCIGVISWYSFRIQKIQCYLNENPCTQLLSDALATLHGKSLIGVDLDQRAEELLTTHSVLVDQVDKQFPGQLLVTLSDVQLLYRFELASESWDVNEHGQRFTTSNTPLTKIKTSLQPQDLFDSNQHVIPAVHEALRVLAHSSLKDELEYGELLDTKTLSMNLKGNLRALVSLDDTATHLAELSYILTSTEYRTLRQDYQEIDVRFKLPVLRKKQ